MKKILLNLFMWIFSRYTLIWEVEYSLSDECDADDEPFLCKTYVFALSPEDAKEQIKKYYEVEGFKCIIYSIGGAVISLDTYEIL